MIKTTLLLLAAVIIALILMNSAKKLLKFAFFIALAGVVFVILNHFIR